MLYRSVVLASIGASLIGFCAQAQIVINEICADNASTKSPGDTEPDYVEIYNAGTAAVLLSGWTLTDDATKKDKYAFPNGTSIGAKGRLVVWLDDINTYPGLVTTNFSLRASGETVALFQGITLKDQVIFGPQIMGKVVCRVPDGSNTWTLGSPSPGATNVAIPLGSPAALRINELLATNSLGSDWLELFNPASNGPVAIGGMVFSQSPTATNMPGLSPNSFIDSDGFIQFLCISDTNRGDHLDFKLSSSLGETITLFSSNRTSIVDRVTFGPQSGDVSWGRLPDGGTNFFYFSPTNRVSPGMPNDWLPLTNIVISEVLTHTDPPLEDAIELQNVSGQTVDISNWWLSNSRNEPLKFHIPAGTTIPAYGFRVFYEKVGGAAPGFNRSGTGNSPDFTLNSAHGDEVVLTVGSALADVTGEQTVRDLPSTANGVSLIRYVKSTGGSDMVPASRRTFGRDSNIVSVADFRGGTGLSNAYPLVGPLVVSEIMYHPREIIENGVTNDNTIDEFVELKSISNTPLPLYDPAYPTNTWEVKGGINFRFPTNQSVAAGGCIMLVNFDPVTNLTQLAAFRAKYGVSNGVSLFGPYEGKLKNSSDSVEIYRPDPVQLAPHPDAGFVPSILVEKVKYDQDGGWPSAADGEGYSLHRRSFTGYANDETNWFAAQPSICTVTPPGNPPQITLSPSSQTVPVGTTVSLTVGGSGTAPLGQYWQINGTNLAGAISNPLLLLAAQRNQSGAYTAVVTNNYGSVTSAVATVVIFQPPVIQQQPATLAIARGQSASFSVVVDGSEPLSYRWYFNSNALAGPAANLLTLADVQPSQAGSYFVIVTNNHGAVTSQVAVLNVGVPPILTIMPADQFVAVGSDVLFTVGAAGAGPLAHQWLCNGTNLPGATLPTLTLQNVQTNDSGSFAAVVANAFGATTSLVARLSIAGPPWLLPLTVSTDAIPRITLTGVPGHVYDIQSTLDLNNWITISRFTNFSGQETVTDPTATNAIHRFYRGRLVP